jgi:preprotein translocase subunit Sec63
MRQIFDRISRIISSNFRAKQYHSDILDEDDSELRKIIDELNKDSEDSFNKKKKETRAEARKDKAVEDAYRILGLKYGSPADEIKKAYKQKIKQYHPDRNINLPEENRAEIERNAREVNNAYKVLKAYKNFN